jgi:hypothetical protein
MGTEKGVREARLGDAEGTSIRAAQHNGAPKIIQSYARQRSNKTSLQLAIRTTQSS